MPTTVSEAIIGDRAICPKMLTFRSTAHRMKGASWMFEPVVKAGVVKLIWGDQFDCERTSPETRSMVTAAWLRLKCAPTDVDTAESVL